MPQIANTKTPCLIDHWAPLSLPHPKSSRQPQKERYQAIMHAGLSLLPTLLAYIQSSKVPPWQCNTTPPTSSPPPISTPQMWHRTTTLNSQIPCCQFILLDGFSVKFRWDYWLSANVNCHSESLHCCCTFPCCSGPNEYQLSIWTFSQDFPPVKNSYNVGGLPYHVWV